MKVLIVANYNPGRFSAFVTEQAESLRRLGIEVEYFGIIGKGAFGYLKNLPALKKKIKECNPDLIHAHYGLSGLLATLQTKVPVVVTYHGSDIHKGGIVLLFSKLAMYRADYNIIVADHLKKIAKVKQRVSVIPCGVDDKTFFMINKQEARTLLNWNRNMRYVLFAGAFDREVKNPALAKAVVSGIKDCQLIELKGYSRQQVNLLLNAADCLLMTSHNEGSPQIIKEAMCTGTPIVTVNVGDVEDICSNTKGCYICNPDVVELRHAVESAFTRTGKTTGPEVIKQKLLSIDNVAEIILRNYNDVVKRV